MIKWHQTVGCKGTKEIYFSSPQQDFHIHMGVSVGLPLDGKIQGWGRSDLPVGESQEAKVLGQP